jgi:hypothetical protein
MPVGGNMPIECQELYERKSKETKYLCSFTTIDRQRGNVIK